MTWEQCKSFGVTQIHNENSSVRLYYNRYNFMIANPPLFLIVETAIWQGEQLILKGQDKYGTPMVYLMNGFNDSQRIF